MSELQPEWEKPDEDDIGNVLVTQKMEPNGMDLSAILLDNQECKREIKETRLDMLNLIQKMGDLTVAMNAVTIGQRALAAAAPAPVPAELGAGLTTTTAPSLPLGLPSLHTVQSAVTVPNPVGAGLATTSVPHVPPISVGATGSESSGIPAGLGVYKPIWSTASNWTPPTTTHAPMGGAGMAYPGLSARSAVVPPLNPSSLPTGQGWSGWGQQQGTPGQVGVPMVPPTLLPQALLHQDWFADNKSSESKGKRSKHWMRPDFYIPTEKRYDELSYRELMFGMISVAECMARYNLPSYPLLNYLEHLKFVAMKGMSASFTPESIAKYEFLLTSKVLAGLLPVHIPADHESVYTHLSAENTVAIKASSAATTTKKAAKSGQGWFRCPKDICLKWNQDRCDRTDCDRKHVCATCHQDHIVKKCVEGVKRA